MSDNWGTSVADATTIPELFVARCSESPRDLAYKFHVGGGWRDVTWAEFKDRVDGVAAGFLALGFEAGGKIAIIGDTRPEWGICDLAAVSVGAVTVGLYQTSTAEQWAHILSDCDANIVIVDTPERFERLRLVRDQIKATHIICWDAPSDLDPDKGELSLYGLTRLGDEVAGAGEEIASRRRRVVASSPAVFVYTSGTTGPPKGAIIGHENVLTMLTEGRTMEVVPGDITLSYLPMCHVAEKVVSFYGRMVTNIATAYARSLQFDIFLEDLAAIRPTIFGSVPRIFEKIYAKAHARAEAAGGVKHRIFRWACRTGVAVSRCWQQGRQPSRALALQHRIADRLVFSRIRAIFGGRVRYFISGAAPISVDVLEFFHGAGMPIYEVYGMTEATAVSTTNTEEEYRFGTVGKPIAGVELKLAEDGEILVRGKTVFLGYHNQPDVTADTIDKQGWLHTGDIGEIDRDGFVKIVDRKKNIIITAGGKNVTPSNIENLVKDDPYVSNCVVIGDRRPFLTALITLDEDEVTGLCDKLGVSIRAVERLAKDDMVIAHVQAAVDRANGQLGKVEQVKRFRILPHELTIDAGEITPTLKVRRKNVATIHDACIEEMYGSSAR
jgi:long-chain acyl-CoA synthetase